MEQKYGYVPGLVKTNENLSSVSSALDLNTPSVLTTVCGISSRFVHVTVVPAGTVSAAGPKLKLSIFTSAVAAAFSCAATASPTRPTGANIASRVMTATDTPILQKFLLMTFSSH